MGIWEDIATWRPTSSHGGPMIGHRGLVLHIAEGSFEGTISWCHNTSAGVSAHFVVSKSGAIAQLVDTDAQSWCQAAGNREWLSAENEGYSGDSLTPEQVEACARILARSHQEHGVPLVVANSPDGEGLGHHSMGGPLWGGHDHCPGELIIAQKSEIIAAARRLLDITDGEDDDVRSFMRYRDSPHVFLTDGVNARWIASEGEVKDLRTLSEEGTIRLGYNGQVRVVARRELVGRIVGRVPSGWEDLAA